MNIAFLYIKEKIASTVYDHIEAFKKHSKYNIVYLDIFTDILNKEQLNKFDVIIIHYTISIFRDDRCPAWLRLLIRNANAKKVVFIQDEYRRINDVVENLSYLKIDVLFTCVPEGEIEKVYPCSKLPNLLKVNTLTGFVPQDLLERARIPYDKRGLDVVYRARKIPAWLGRLGQEKWQIAAKFADDAVNFALATDISYQEKDRVYGEAWIQLLESSKAAIGCESGASVFDFTGEIQQAAEAYEQDNPHAAFEDIEDKFFKGLEGKIKLNQISPRCFECAALGTLMILYEGEYSGILEPWRHYVPLKKDHSNMPEVVKIVRDPIAWQNITRHAYEEIALNPKYTHQAFIKEFDRVVDEITLRDDKKPSTADNSIPSAKLDFHNINVPKRSFKLWGFECLMNIINRLPPKVGCSIKTKLINFSKRTLNLIRVSYSLIKRRHFQYVLFCWNKRFCEEYELINHIIDYSLLINKVMGKKIISIACSTPHEVKIYLDPDKAIAGTQNFNYLASKKTIKAIIADSWGVPEDIRGKELNFKYVELMKKILV